MLIEAAARSFLHHQVRSMVGTLALVGLGQWREEQVAEALEARDRTALGLNAPAEGLYFVEALYPGGLRPLATGAGDGSTTVRSRLRAPGSTRTPLRSIRTSTGTPFTSPEIVAPPSSTPTMVRPSPSGIASISGTSSGCTGPLGSGLGVGRGAAGRARARRAPGS